MTSTNGTAEIHELQFLETELTANNTRYDNLVAGGSDGTRFLQWTVYASISLVVAAFVSIVLLSILCHRSVLRKTFNLYLVFLMIPDLVFSLRLSSNLTHFFSPWSKDEAEVLVSSLAG